MRRPLFTIARVADEPWWSRRGWMFLTPDEYRSILMRRSEINDEPHRGPCRCKDCVITAEDDEVARWRKAMRTMGMDPW